MKRKYSLKKHKDFSYVYRRGKSFSAPCAVLLVARGIPGKVQVGLSVSKKLGNAVTRNKCKRRLREVIRPLLPQMRRNVKIILVGRVSMVDMDYQKLQQQVYRLFAKADLFSQKQTTAQTRRTSKESDLYTQRDKASQIR